MPPVHACIAISGWVCSRGRPLGSKTKQRPEDSLGPAGTPLEAMHRMISTKKLSSKINYSVLDNLFDQLRPCSAAAAGA